MTKKRGLWNFGMLGIISLVLFNTSYLYNTDSSIKTKTTNMIRTPTHQPRLIKLEDNPTSRPGHNGGS